MKIAFECVPCLIRQSIEAARMVTDDIAMQQDIIKKSLKEVSQLNFSETAPYFARIVHRYIKEVSGNDDPYKSLKVKYNEVAAQICHDFNLHDLIKNSRSPVDTACRLSIAGNIIDFGVSALIEEEEVRASIEECVKTEIEHNMTPELVEAVHRASKILFIADNSGEIVFDKLLINELPKEKITYVVKGEPIVNDATMEDAVEVGMIDLVRVIDNGSDAQGTILALCSGEFKKEFDEADLIIAKGQANYETLSELTSKEIFFLLKAKCPSIAEDLQCLQGDLVIKRII
jgi:uncharacterized protein with ATP-grasp and redox domains